MCLLHFTALLLAIAAIAAHPASDKAPPPPGPPGPSGMGMGPACPFQGTIPLGLLDGCSYVQSFVLARDTIVRFDGCADQVPFILVGENNVGEEDVEAGKTTSGCPGGPGALMDLALLAGEPYSWVVCSNKNSTRITLSCVDHVTVPPSGDGAKSFDGVNWLERDSDESPAKALGAFQPGQEGMGPIGTGMGQPGMGMGGCEVAMDADVDLFFNIVDASFTLKEDRFVLFDSCGSTNNSHVDLYIDLQNEFDPFLGHAFTPCPSGLHGSVFNIALQAGVRYGYYLSSEDPTAHLKISCVDSLNPALLPTTAPGPN